MRLFIAYLPITQIFKIKDKPTLQYVSAAYFHLKGLCVIDPNDHKKLIYVKDKLLVSMNQK